MGLHRHADHLPCTYGYDGGICGLLLFCSLHNRNAYKSSKMVASIESVREQSGIRIEYVHNLSVST